MSINDPVESETPVFTEEELFWIIGYVAASFGITDEKKIAEATKEAIPMALNKEK